MKASLDWLNSYLDRPCDAAEAQRLLTAVGFPVEDMSDVALGSGGRDVALDVEITSNRGDCLSHLGLARELAAAPPEVPPEVSPEVSPPRQVLLPASPTSAPTTGQPIAQYVAITNEEPALCPLYTAQVVTGVKVARSPQWLIDRLEAVGLRSVNNVVDVTNFVLLEWGQPLHAFDLGKLSGATVVVRRARQGESFRAIDGSKHELASDMLVIADGQRPVAVAGVMGGLESEVGDATVDLLIESARFAPLSVRQTSRALKLASDSSYRFERGVDPAGVTLASQRAAELILELAGGTLAEGMIRVGETEPAPREVAMRVDRCSALLGEELSGEEQAALLGKLGFQPRQEAGRIVCSVPTHRLDVHREVDLIEEVGRLHGFNDLATRPRIEIAVRAPQPKVRAGRALADVLVAHGYHETVTFSFVAPRQGEAFLEGAGAVRIDDERRKAEPMLRPSILPSLLVCRKANQDAGNTGVRLFETGATWRHEAGGHVEHRRVGMLADVDRPQRAVRDLRGTIGEMVERLGGPAAVEQLAFEPAEHQAFSTAATVTLAGRPLGVMGLLGDGVREVFDVKVALAAGELLIEPMLALYPASRQVVALPRQPAIARDLSIVVDEAVRWRDVAAVVDRTAPAGLETVEFLDTYRGKPIAGGSKSVSFRMVFRDPAKTLRHEEVDPQMEAVVGALKRDLAATLRS